MAAVHKFLNMLKNKPFPANASIGSRWEQLCEIHNANKNVAILQRDIKYLHKELKHFEQAKFELTLLGCSAEISAELAFYFKSNFPGISLLPSDMAAVLKAFEKISRASAFKFSLCTIHSDMCRRFHADMNDLRLLCTYRGPATLWLPNEALSKAATMEGTDNEEMVIDKKLIQKANTGDVLILKGSLYPNARPILHKSPEVEASGKGRLLLKIDTN